MRICLCEFMYYYEYYYEYCCEFVIIEINDIISYALTWFYRIYN
jgi:hypothetical protein